MEAILGGLRIFPARRRGNEPEKGYCHGFPSRSNGCAKDFVSHVDFSELDDRAGHLAVLVANLNKSAKLSDFGFLDSKLAGRLEQTHFYLLVYNAAIKEFGEGLEGVDAATIKT